MQRGRYREEEIIFLKQNAQKYGFLYCAEQLKREPKGILAKCNRLGLKVKQRNEDLSTAPKFYSDYKPLTLNFNETEYPKELAYFFGYFWADGYVSKRGQISLEITEEDGNIIDSILSKIASFEKYKRHCNNRKPQICFGFGSQENANILRTLGKYPNSVESHKKILTFIPKKYHLYFLRGLFDGDGSLCFNKSSTYFSISGNYEQDWDYLCTILQEYGLYCRTEQRIYNSGSRSSEIRNTNSLELYNFFKRLYANNDGIYLPRKYEKVQYLFYKIEH